MKAKNLARIAGALFLIAMAASLLGSSFDNTAVTYPFDKSVIIQNETLIVSGVILELINAASVIGIAAIMYSVLKRYNPAGTAAYFGFRLIEAVCCSIIVIGPMSVLQLCNTGSSEPSGFQAMAASLAAQRVSTAGLLVPFFFGIGAILFYRLLYRSKIVPRFISVWGLLAAILMLAENILSAFIDIDFTIAMITALPIILNEVFLGIWLIVKGFNLSEERGVL